MTPKEKRQPATKAGRALLAALERHFAPSGAWLDFAPSGPDRILAIEAEAQATNEPSGTVAALRNALIRYPHEDECSIRIGYPCDCLQTVLADTAPAAAAEKAKIEAAAVERYEAELRGIANLAHLAWTDPKTVRAAFTLIEAKARALLKKEPASDEKVPS